MASMTIRNFDEKMKTRLRIRAATHGRSMEDEARAILRAALSVEPGKQLGLATSIRSRLAGIGGLDLELPTREPIREPSDLGS